MIVSSLTLLNFRNYEKLEIEFTQGKNIILGKNGAGKTNIIEALSVLSNLRSFRNVSDSELIRWGERNYYCSAVVMMEKEGWEQRFGIGFSIENGITRKKLNSDGSEITKATEYYGRFLTSIFAPADIMIIDGNPENRRRYFDGLISKYDRTYLKNLVSFKKILKSRNTLIKSFQKRKKRDEQIDVWDRLFAEKATELIRKRNDFLKEYVPELVKYYLNISGELISPSIDYHTTCTGDKDEICAELKKRMMKDIKHGSTSIGPQRDDYVIKKNERDFSSMASQGQKRICALALKFSEIELVEKKSGKKVVLMIDDVFSELDANKRKNLLRLLPTDNQVIFTVVDVKENIFQDYDGKKYYIEDGKLLKQ